MSELKYEEDQAIGLRKQMEEREQKEENDLETNQALPPRAVYHNKKNQKTKIKFKLSFPWIRLLLLLFIILIIVTLTSPYWLSI